MSSFRFRRFDSPSTAVTWSIAAICVVALLSLVVVDAKLVIQFLATLFLAATTAVIAVLRVSALRARAAVTDKAAE